MTAVTVFDSAEFGKFQTFAAVKQLQLTLRLKRLQLKVHLIQVDAKSIFKTKPVLYL